MDKLYSPWRIDYILGEKRRVAYSAQNSKQNDDEGHLILKRGEKTYIVMNLYPYNNGHLMVVPFGMWRVCRSLQMKNCASSAK